MPKLYDIGYRRPPKHSQFKKGQSGNPKGRPKGRKNLKTDLQEELQKRVKVTEGGKQMIVTKQKALAISLCARALQGDARATVNLTDLVLRLLPQDDPDDANRALSQNDQAIVEAYLEWRLAEKLAELANEDAPDGELGA